MTLAFLAPALLATTALVAVPILVHLISRRRARVVRFAAIEFVLRSRRRTARSIRLRQFLLLLVRALMLAALGAAIAGPMLVREKTHRLSSAPLAVGIVIDVSASMQAQVENQSFYSQALRRAVEVLSALPVDVPVAILSCGERAADVLVPASFDRSAASTALFAVQPEFGRSDLGVCAARAAAVLGEVTGEGERRVIILSDLAAHALSGAGSQEVGGDVVIEFVGVGLDPAPPNHALVSVEAIPGAGASGEAVELGFEVATFGGVSGEIPADLVLEGKSVARVTLPVSPGDLVKGAFTHAFGEAQARTPHVTLTLGPDALLLDNEVELPVELPRPIRVVIVDGAPQPIPFRDEVFYLESALRQPKSSRARMFIDVIGTEALNAGALAEARVVVLANVSRLPPDAVAALTEFVRAGGGLLITMGDQIDVPWANEALAALLPGRLRGAKGQALLDNANVAEVLGLTRFATEHPAFQGLASGEAGGLSGLSRVQTDTLMLLEPQADAPREVLAWFTNQSPALVERRVDTGRVVLLATTIDRDWSDLAIRPGFLPLTQQLIAYLGGALDRGGPRLIEVGETRQIAVPRGTMRLEVRPPAGESTVVDGEALRQTGGGLRVRIPFERTLTPGLYRVFVQREGGELRELSEEKFGVLIPRGESDLTRANEAALQKATPKGASRRTSDRDTDTPLWPALLALAILLLLAESLILRRRSSR